MHLQAYQVPTTKVKVTEVKGERREFPEDVHRIEVVIRGDGPSEADVILDGRAVYRLGLGEHVSLPRLYVGAFAVDGTAVVAEFLRHDA